MKRRKLLRLFSVASLIPILLFFQNCSQVRFLASESSDLLKGQNNGGGYGGKPGGDYYRFVPDFTCEGQESFQTHIRIDENNVTIAENRRTQCVRSGVSLDPSLLDTSIYQNDVIGYLEGIFESASLAPTKIPANLVEVWCRDSKDQSGIETITHFDRSTNTAVTRIHFAAPDAGGALSNQTINDFPVARVINSKSVIVRNELGFELTVHRDQPAAETGLFKAELQAVINGNQVTRPTSCRLGGSLDSTVWPAQQIVDNDIAYLKISPDQKNLAYTTATNTPANNHSLFLSNLDGSRQNLLSQNLSISNWQLLFSPDSKKLAYLIDNLSFPAANLMSADVDGTSPVEISNLTTGSSLFSISADSQSIVYNSGDFTNPWLKSAAISGGGNLTDLNPAFPASSPSNTSGLKNVGGRFSVSSTGNQVAFLCCRSTIDLYVSQTDGSALTRITPSLPSGYVVDGAVFPLSNSDRLLQVTAWANPTPSSTSFITFLMTIDGSRSLLIPNEWLVESVSPSGDFVILLSTKDRITRQIANLKNGSYLPLPASADQIYSSPFIFAQDSASVVGWTEDPELMQDKAVMISTVDGAVQEICPGVASSAVHEVRANTFVVLSEDANAGQIRVYLKSAAQACQQVNSVPISSSAGGGLSLAIAPDGAKILVQKQNQLFYIPLNGRPAYQVNTPVFLAADIKSFQFLNDSRSVLFTGHQIRASENHAFLWTAPSN